MVRRSISAIRTRNGGDSAAALPRQRIRPELEVHHLAGRPLPASLWNGARVLTVTDNPRPFHPAAGESIRPGP
jgi:hypothetical protein